MLNALLHPLLARVSQHDDPAAYKEIFLYYYKRLVHFSAAITRNHEFAEEVVNDVFLKLWMNRKSLSEIENFHLYIYVTTRNLSINRYIKEKKLQSIELDSHLDELEIEYHTPEDLMITSEMKERIDMAIRSLPTRCRIIFKLIKEDGFKYKEVAALLEISQKTVENQMAIALKKIAGALHVAITKSLN